MDKSFRLFWGHHIQDRHILIWIYPWISTQKSVDMDMDMDWKFHIHGNPGNSGSMAERNNEDPQIAGTMLIRLIVHACAPTCLYEPGNWFCLSAGHGFFPSFLDVTTQTVI